MTAIGDLIRRCRNFPTRLAESAGRGAILRRPQVHDDRADRVAVPAPHYVRQQVRGALQRFPSTPIRCHHHKLRDAASPVVSIARRSSSRVGVGVRSFEPAFESAQRLPVDAGRGFDERPLHAGLH